jgi:hypothetical protein
MKKTTLLAIGITALVVWIGTSFLVTAQEKASAQRYESALIKWDGTDKVCVNLPGKSDIWHVFELSGTRTPKDIQEEEFCLAWTANKLASEGWESVNLDSRRILLRRSVSR